jgi:hypothetical protein
MARRALADPAFLAKAAQYAEPGVIEVQVLLDRHPVEFTEPVAEFTPTRLTAIG